MGSAEAEGLAENPKDVDCGHPDQALEVAAYIVNEIQKNILSHDVLMMRLANDCFPFQSPYNFNIAAPFLRCAIPPERRWGGFPRPSLLPNPRAGMLWAEKVKPGGDWDHKGDIADKFRTEGRTTRYHHKYKKFEYYYDIWSNIHYGYIGLYSGFSRDALLEGAGAAQLYDNLRRGRDSKYHLSNGLGFARGFDDVTDNLSVRLGMHLFTIYPDPTEITAEMVMELVASAPFPIQEYSKLPHRCGH